MAMSEKEKRAYLAEITPQVEAAADAVFLKKFGRSFNDDDMRLAKLPHGKQNGSSRPQDSLEKIRHDFPSLFGPGNQDATP